jgi:hypothetical protein
MSAWRAVPFGPGPSRSEMHLAQLNVGRLKAPDEGGDATSIKPFGDELEIINLTVWESIEALADFTYRSGHVELLRLGGSSSRRQDGRYWPVVGPGGSGRPQSGSSARSADPGTSKAPMIERAWRVLLAPPSIGNGNVRQHKGAGKQVPTDWYGNGLRRRVGASRSVSAVAANNAALCVSWKKLFSLKGKIDIDRYRWRPRSICLGNPAT